MANNRKSHKLHGAGLGLRRGLFDELYNSELSAINFFEIAPENWMLSGGRHKQHLDYFSERFPIICHGLSLSLGSPDPLDHTFIKEVKAFLDNYEIETYSEHLSYCSMNGHLYDLLPIPFTEEAIMHVSERIRQTQDILQRRIAIENVSYYCAPGQQMSEIDFLLCVLQEADCDLLLDVNNIYVNSVNHGYNPHHYLRRIPKARIRYIHVAGHHQEKEDLIIDTHGAAVITPVWHLLRATYQLFGDIPTLLERDFGFPPLAELMDEVMQIKQLQIASKAPEVLHA